MRRVLSAALQDRLRALAPREIALLATGAAVAALWLGVDSHDRYRAAVDRASAAATSAATAQEQLLSYGSADLQRRIADELDRARHQTISGPTVELAELQLQDELSVAATRAGLRNPQVTAVRSEDDRKPIRAIAATVEGDYDRGALIELIANLAQSETGIRVTEIDVRNDGAAPRVALTGEAIFVAPGILR